MARENVLSHLSDTAHIAVSFHAGDLLSCVAPDMRFSLIYENLPNIPATANLELRHGAISGRFFAPAPRLPNPSRPTSSRSTTAASLRPGRGCAKAAAC